MAEGARTDWRAILTVTFGGAAAAMQVGKAGACLPLIRAEFGAQVSFLAIYIALISIVAATVGMGFGLVTARIGTRRSASLGLGLIAIASLAAALVESAGPLIALRLVEALGFTFCTTSMPVLIRSSAGTRRQSLALGVWATWIPLGVAGAMAVAALWMDGLGWRGVFVLCAVPPVLALGALWWAVPKPKVRPPHFPQDKLMFLRPELLLHITLFTAFSAANIIYMGFLPTILVDMLGHSVEGANLIALLGVLCLVPTAILTGQVLDRGASIPALMLGSFVVLGLTPALIVATSLPDAVHYIAIAVFGAAAGVPPAIIWASVPRLARVPEEGPVVSGLFYQGAGLGQILGPVAVGYSFDLMQSWWAAVWATALFCVVGLVLSVILQRLSHCPTPTRPS